MDKWINDIQIDLFYCCAPDKEIQNIREMGN